MISSCDVVCFLGSAAMLAWLVWCIKGWKGGKK